jgi:putative transposase
MARIDYWHTRCPYLGSRKIVAKLQEEGFSVCRKTVRRLMLKMGIYAVYPKPNLSKRNFKESIVPYLLRNYNVSFPNQVWSIDITYIPMPHGHMYLTAIIDWYSRRLVGHYLSDSLEAEAVIHAVRETVKACGVPAIINSDQGSQFTSDDYKELLRSLNIRQSMDGRSRWADNIMIERWFRSLKTEEIYLNEYHSPRELRQALERYVTDYNSLRPHEAIGYKTPDEVFASCFPPRSLNDDPAAALARTCLAG